MSESSEQDDPGSTQTDSESEDLQENVSVTHDPVGLEATVPSQKGKLSTFSSSTTSAHDSQENAPVASTSERYEVGREIARGGMGAILEATDPALDRTVAMKVLLSRRDSVSARLRFIREAAVLGRLEHPNIVPIHELNTDPAGQLFYTMKKVEGRTLQAILTDLGKGDANTAREWPLDRLISVFLKICDAIAFAHSRGVIHRDLKPDNVMIGQFGEVLVMDWGLAKLPGDDQSPIDAELSSNHSEDEHRSRAGEDLTMEGAVMGSPRYMPPEQAEGRVAEIDEQSDIFSLGGILYAILTLCPPVSGTSASEIIERVRSGDIVPPSDLASKSPTDRGESRAKVTALPHCPAGRVPSALSAITMRAMATEKNARYREVEEFAADISAYQHGYATSAENLGTLGLLRLWFERNRALAVTGSGLLAVIGYLWFSFTLNLNSEKNHARREAENASQARRLAELEKDKAKGALAENAYLRGNHFELTNLLAEIATEHRGPDWKYLMQRSRRAIDEWNDLGPVRGRPMYRIPPDGSGGEWVFLTGSQSQPEVLFLDANSGEERRRIKLEAAEKSATKPVEDQSDVRHLQLSFSPNGSRMAVAGIQGANVVSIIDIATGETLEHRTFAGGNRVAGVEFTDNDALAVVLADRNRISIASTLCRFEIGGPTFWRFRKLGAPERSGYPRLATSYPAHQIAFVNLNSVSVHAPDTGYQEYEISTRVNQVCAVQFSSDGTYLAVGEINGSVAIWDTRKRKPVSQFHVGYGVQSMRFLGDRHVVALAAESANDFAIGSKRLGLWEVQTGREIDRQLGLSRRARSIGVASDSGMIIEGGGIVGVDPDTFIESVRLFRFGRPEEEITLPISPFAEGVHRRNSLVFGGEEILIGVARGQYADLASADPEQFVHLASGQDYAKFVGSPDGSEFVGFANRNSTRAITNPSAAQAIQHWRMIEGEPAKQRLYPIGNGRLHEIGAWANESRMVAVQFLGKGIRVLSLTNGNIVTEIDNKLLGLPVSHLGFTDHDSKLIVCLESPETAAAPTSRLQLYRLSDGTLLNDEQFAGHIPSLAVSPDGGLIAIARSDETMQLRRGSDLRHVRTMRVHDKPVTALNFHPHKPIVMTGSWDMSVRAWNLETGNLVDEIVGLSGQPQRLAFSPTGGRVAVLNEHASLVWPFSMRGFRPRRVRSKQILLEQTLDFRSESTRKITSEITVTKEEDANYELQIGIGHGYDNTGDKGISFNVKNDKGESLLAGFADKKSWLWFRTSKVSAGKLTIIWEDEDTSFKEPYPGNKADVKVNLIRF